MATSVDFVEFVCGQVSGTGAVRYKKMFGEYMMYVDDKPILLVCDNTVFVKILPCLDELMANADRGYPYNGAKEHYVLDIEDRDLTTAVIEALLPVIPVPKPKKKKADKLVLVGDMAALKKWGRINKQDQKLLLSNVFCGNCGVTTIVNYSANDDKFGIVLCGECKQCGTKVARVIENEWFEGK